MRHNYPRGSEWRKWDLHVHSPASHDFIGDWNNFEAQLKNADCDVIGINDYFSVAGYKYISEEINQGRLDLGNKKILPVVEFRMTDSVQNKNTKTNSAIHFNFHIIFDDSIDLDDIENLIKSLDCNGTKISNDYNDKTKLQDKKISFNDLLATLEKDEKFKNKYLVWLPYDEYGGIDEIDPKSDAWIKSNFIRKSHILGSSRKKQIEFFLWKSDLNKDDAPKFTQEQFQSWFDNKKPCIKGSDSHDYKYPIGKLKNEKSEPTEKYCWIKADPTFEGLKQIVYEPEGRVRIHQEKPEEKTNYTFIDSVRFIDSRKNKEFDDKWIPLNQNLNSIIGGKSSGKSLLLYHIAKTIDPERIDNINSEPGTYKKLEYPFENEDNFDFEVKWADGVSQTLRGSNNPNRPATYIPQLYLNRLAEDQKIELNNLVDNMLIDSSEKYKTFRDINKRKREDLRTAIAKEVDDYYKAKERMNDKEKELKALGDKTAVEENLKSIKEKIDNLRKESSFSADEEAKYTKLTEADYSFGKSISETDMLIKGLEMARSRFLSFKNGISTLLNESIVPEIRTLLVDISEESISTILNTITNIYPIIEKAVEEGSGKGFLIIDEKKAAIEKLKIKQLEIKNELIPLAQKVKNQMAFVQLQKDLDMETEKLKTINLKEIEVEWLRKRYITTNIKAKYSDLFNCYQDIIAKNKENDKCKNISDTGDFSIGSFIKIDAQKFNENYLHKINKKKSLSQQFGDFFDENSNYLFDASNHLNNVNFMIDKITRGDIGFKAGHDEEHAMYSLLEDYFYVDYDLLQNGDNLMSMSPGKIGIILFQLFLHLSQSRNPILIDQPEDNLDNRTVYQELNEFIKTKKIQRQIIIVSHNPNLVVSTDSENVIVANQDGQNKTCKNFQYKFEYVSGAIENSFIDSSQKGILFQKGIRQHVCDILEGGEEAFEKRENKYGFQKKK